MTVQPENRSRVPGDTFGNRLALMRHELGLSLDEAADRAGLKRATWRTWEKGLAKPRDMIAVVNNIADAFGYDAQWLAFGGALGIPKTPRPGPDGGSSEVVRQQGLEPRTRWFAGSQPTSALDEAA
jgi:transcriptional regulator with XRE-family HTH domain